MVVFYTSIFLYRTFLVLALGEENAPKLAYAKNMRAIICRLFYIPI